MTFYLINPDAEHRGILLIKANYQIMPCCMTIIVKILDAHSTINAFREIQKEIINLPN